MDVVRVNGFGFLFYVLGFILLCIFIIDILWINDFNGRESVIIRSGGEWEYVFNDENDNLVDRVVGDDDVVCEGVIGFLEFVREEVWVDML